MRKSFWLMDMCLSQVPFRHEIRGGRSVAGARRAPPETAQDLPAFTRKVGFEFGPAAHNGWVTGKARECYRSGKPVVGLIHFLLSLPLAYRWLTTGYPMARQCPARPKAAGPTSGTEQAMPSPPSIRGRPLIWLSPAHFLLLGKDILQLSKEFLAGGFVEFSEQAGKALCRQAADMIQSHLSRLGIENPLDAPRIRPAF